MKRLSRQENLIYLIAWGVLFASPLLSLYVRSVHDYGVVFDWAEVFVMWRKFTLYLLLFLIHNFLLAPLFVHKQRRMAYYSIMVVLVGLFSVYQCNSRPDIPEEPDIREFHERPEPPRPPKEELRGGHRPPPIVGEHDIMAIVVFILMLGVNLGTKFYFRSRDDRKRMAELERQNLEQQLEYLRYQINPHFFMNTLNNIHALVEIDPAKAQETIVELSRMMRYVLYEGDKRGVTLSREMEFIRTYIKLMKLRYTDKVRITLDRPTELPDRTIPPLVLISFVENAFKHGISYRHDSFIEVRIEALDEKLCFACRNSKADTPNAEKGGVGLANVRRRLDLLYDHDYTLHIQDAEDVYTVELNIPYL